MKIDYSLIESTRAEPEASTLIETFRAIGYTIETAIADIIDNSISAGAKNIWVDYCWSGETTVIGIMDDGRGMTNEELIQAMHPANMGPLKARSPHDLGRFGLGLKTASFSQCRKFCVSSKKNGTESFWTWDLDFVADRKTWEIIKYRPSKIDLLKKFSELDHGTLVLWWDIDRLTKGTEAENEKAKYVFFEAMDRVKHHLSMVFHRYIEDNLNIWLKDRKIDSWDPFMIGHNGLQAKPETKYDDGRVCIKGFILPHRSKLSEVEYNIGRGPKQSWTAHQGFYVYRNRRLIVSGDWLGMFRKEVHYDLCRIRVDLLNSIDIEWQIDIKKSSAHPPVRLKEKLFAIAKDVRNQAVEVYRHRGKVVQRKVVIGEYFPLWLEKTRHGKRFYNINREHPILKNLKLDSEMTLQFEKVLQFIEETVPIPLITLQESENEKSHGQPFEGKNHSIIIDIMKSMYRKLLEEGMSPKRAKERISFIEPFNYFIRYLEDLDD